MLLHSTYPTIDMNTIVQISTAKIQASWNLDRYLIAIQKNILEENHPDIATSINTFGIILRRQGNLAKAQIKVQKQQQLEQWVNENLAYYKNLQRTGNSNKSNESLSSLVNRSAKSLSITIARMQPQGDNLQVWIDEVPFDHFVTWIDQLNRQEATRVLAVDLSVGNAPGTVKVRRLQVGK